MADIMGGSPFEEVCKLMHKQIPLEEMKKKLDVIKNGGTL
jgi:mannose/fructose-specific phosphotransferase system component IIA